LGWPHHSEPRRLLTLVLVSVLFVHLGWIGATFGGSKISLAELEERIDASPQVLAAVAELECQINLYEREQALSGWKVIAGVSNGTYRESTDVDRTRDFNQASVRLGLRYPLLGSRAREQLNILRAEARTWESRMRAELTARIGLNALRTHYVDLWAGMRRIQLSEAFLEGRETLEGLLAARTAQGFLLDADRQEFLTAFELALRNIANARGLRQRAFAVIDLLTRSDLSALEADAPELATPCLDEARLRARILEGHPELALHRGLVNEQMSSHRLTSGSEIDASLDLAGSASIDYPEGEPGYGLALSFNVQFPAGLAKAGEARRRSDEASLRKARFDLDVKAGQLQADASHALEQYRAAQANLSFARQRVKAARESVRERQLRADHLPGDTLEQLQRSRFQYYQTGMDLIDAEALLLHSQAALLLLEPEGCGETATAPPGDLTASVAKDDPLELHWFSWPRKPSRIAHTPPGHAAEIPGPVQGPNARAVQKRSKAVYLWESAPWLYGSLACEAAMKGFSDLDIDRILISMDRRQIDAASKSEGAGRVRELLRCAHGSGVRVELLLGEPTWILPDFRQDMLAIIHSLKDIPFDGLHLDLEPDQLDMDHYSREYLLSELIHTVQAAREVSPWPLGLSVHPRYFDPTAFKVSLGSALEAAGVAEVALMVYIADADKVARRVSPILKENPALHFSVAMSVEPELSPAESFAVQGRAALRKAMDRLAGRLTQKNFGGFVIQSWKHLEAMKP